jgi:sigma-B regulation protein RsbU (phosphoserine phosphatase)
VQRRFFFPARVDDVARYATQVVACLGDGFEGTLVHAAISEALLNGILYGALGVRPAAPTERDPVAFFLAIRDAEVSAGPRAGVTLDVETSAGPPPVAAVRVTDPGAGFDWRARAAELDAARGRFDAVGGRGLVLMRAGARSVRWNEAGNEVTLVLGGAPGVGAPSPPAAPAPSAVAAGPAPPAAAGPAPSPRPPPREARASEAPVAPGLARVLVVDDVPTNVQLLRLMLEREGYQVEGVGDGRAALARARAWRPHLALVDVRMPGMDGLELVGRMSELGLLEQTSVILLTAVGQNADVRSAGIELGACDFLQKPISRRELVARVRRALATRQNLRQVTGERNALQDSVGAAARVMGALIAPPHVACGRADVSTLVAPDQFVGGDVVDVVRISPSRWAAALLDVAGHGLAAALTAAASRAVLRDRLLASHDGAAALAGLNARLYEDSDQTGQHVAVAMLVVDEARGEVEVFNAGCPPVAAWPAEGPPALVRSSAPPAGILGELRFVPACFPLATLRRAVVVSDGVTERFAGPSGTLEALGALFGGRMPDLGEPFPRARAERAIARLGDERDDASVVWVDFRP